MERGIRVYLLAASRLVREALARVITRKGDIHVVGSGAGSPELVDRLLSTEHDLLLADWPSSGAGVLDTLRELRESLPEYKSVLLGVRGDREGFLESVRAGAKGILLEDASATDVTAAIRTVARGQAVCPPKLCGYLFDVVASQFSSLPNSKLRLRLGLTRREQQLVPLIAQGYTNKEIAIHLCLSEQTVKNHVHRMLQKTGANGRLEVVEACVQESPALAVYSGRWYFS